MTIDHAYTLDDHEFRDNDEYALAKYRLTLRWLRGRPRSSTLLNIGCGGGTFTDMAFTAGFDVRGVEPDGDAHELAARRAAGRYPVDCCGLFDVPTTCAADVVVMHDVLEHIDAEGAAIQSLAELVRPGGVAVVSVPAFDSLFGYHDRQLGHFRRYSKTSLRRALGTHFVIERTRYLGATGVPVVLWYSRFKDEPYPIAATEGGAGRAVLRAVCAIEERVPAPIGTSVLAMIHAR